MSAVSCEIKINVQTVFPNPNNGLIEKMVRDDDGRAWGTMCGEEVQKDGRKVFRKEKKTKRECFVRYK